MLRLRLTLVVLAGCGWSAIANAYPQYIGKGYTNCATCHYSPSGGGFVNSYGSAQQEAFFPSVVSVPWIEKVRQKADVTGIGEDGTPQLQVGAGADSRFALSTVPSIDGQKAGLSFFPMLLEVGGVVAYGKFLAYGSIGVKEPEADGIPWKPFSREHWLQFKATSTFSVRAGRMVLPFGLRLPDHTAYTRAEMDFGYYAQSYAAEADYVSDRLVVNAAAFLGDPTETAAGLRERGGVASVTYNIEGRAALGVSAYYGDSALVRREMAGLFARLRLLGASYLLAEVDGQHRGSDLAGVKSLATYARLGWWVLESLDVYLEHGYRLAESLTRAADLAQSRYIAGASWWVLPWFEIAPRAMVETFPTTGAYTSGFIDLHAYF